MEILKRSSNGRGEYELAGSVNDFSTMDLVDLPLVLDTESVLGLVELRIALRSQGGKPRLRLFNTTDDIHIQRQIEALLVMPRSTRDETQLLGGQPILLAQRYVLRSIEVRSVEVSESAATITLGAVDCINDSGSQQIDFVQRLRDIRRLYANAGEFPAAVRDALVAHEQQLSTQHRVTKVTERLVLNIIRAAEEAARESDASLIVGEDPVPLLLDLLGAKPTIEIPMVSEIDPADIDIRRRVADRWRLQKDRGPSSAQFRRDVRRAYKSTCLFCGLRLPTSASVRMPGVDAAHIVPWSLFDADVVSNGLCLCKLHHWAFDQFLLALTHSPEEGYKIVVTPMALATFAADAAVLASLHGVAGPIAPARLPDDPAEWPRPQFLRQLYEDLGVDV